MASPALLDLDDSCWPSTHFLAYTSLYTRGKPTADLVLNRVPGSRQIIDVSAPMQSIPAWFKGAKLSWAENMLRAGTSTPEKTALIECSRSRGHLADDISR